MSFIYSLIANEKKNILLEHSEYDGNFNQVIRVLLGKREKLYLIMISKKWNYNFLINAFIDIKYIIYMKIV